MGASPQGIEETPSICIFLEEADADIRKSIAAHVEEVAKMYLDEGKASGDDPKYRFYIASANQGAVPQLRKMSSMAPVAEKCDKPKPELQKRGSIETMYNPYAKGI